MEKLSKIGHIDRVVGNNTDKENTVSVLSDLGIEKVEGELEKTPRDKQLIDFSQKSLDEYLLNFRENINEIKYENIHIMPVEGVKNLTKGVAFEGSASLQNGAFIVDRNPNDVIFSLRLFHELYHLKDFSSINLDEEGYYVNRRSGVTVFINGEKYFNLINETLNDYFCRKFFEEKIKNSNLFDKQEVEEYIFDSPRIKLLDLFEEFSDDLLEKNKDSFNSKEKIKKLFLMRIILKKP